MSGAHLTDDELRATGCAVRDMAVEITRLRAEVQHWKNEAVEQTSRASAHRAALEREQARRMDLRPPRNVVALNDAPAQHFELFDCHAYGGVAAHCTTCLEPILLPHLTHRCKEQPPKPPKDPPLKRDRDGFPVD